MNFYKYLILTALVLPFASCQKSDQTQSQSEIIAVSIEPQRQIAEALAGDDFEVVTVLDRGANPETFEPSMSRRISIEKSSAYLTIGAFQFEGALIKSVDKKLKTFDTAKGIEPIYGTHSHHHGDIDDDDDDEHHHGDADPHVWTSAKNLKIIASNIASALIELKPENAVTYKSRLDSITAQLDSIDAAISEQLSTLSSRAFIIWHPSLSYFSRDYNLKQIAVGQESKEISPRQMREIIDSAEHDSVKVFFFQKEFDSNQAASISQRTATRLVTIDPLAYDWQQQLNLIANELSRK